MKRVERLGPKNTLVQICGCRSTLKSSYPAWRCGTCLQSHILRRLRWKDYLSPGVWGCSSEWAMTVPLYYSLGEQVPVSMKKKKKVVSLIHLKLKHAPHLKKSPAYQKDNREWLGKSLMWAKQEILKETMPYATNSWHDSLLYQSVLEVESESHWVQVPRCLLELKIKPFLTRKHTPFGWFDYED